MENFSHTSHPIDPSTLSAFSIMSKRADSTRLRVTKVKKRRGVGSRTITVLDSDEDDLPPISSGEYAQVSKTRVEASGKAERVSTSSVPIFETPSTPVPLEEDLGDSMDVVVEDILPAVPAKRLKKVNDSVSDSIYQSLCIANNSLD
jgi:hypothetical protein